MAAVVPEFLDLVLVAVLAVHSTVLMAAVAVSVVTLEQDQTEVTMAVVVAHVMMTRTVLAAMAGKALLELFGVRVVLIP
jgi:hypothetical protein